MMAYSIPEKYGRGAAWLAVAVHFGLAFPPAPAQAQPTMQDSGWVSLFNGKDFDSGFYVYSSGYLDISAQTKFKAENGMIHAGGPYALLLTAREYAYYRMRVDYRFGPAVGTDGNAGMMILMDNQAAKTSTSLRPASIEVNCRRDNGYPWTLWSSQSDGPIMATTVKAGTARFLTRDDGGAAYSVDPAKNRTLESGYPNPELAPGQWNHGEAFVYGDSGAFYLNGHLRTASWHWTANKGGKSVRMARGGVGVQTEGFDIWYAHWEIQELDSATGLPIHARRGCTDPASPGFDPRAVIKDGSCGVASVTRTLPMGLRSSLGYPNRRTLDGRLSRPSAADASRNRRVTFAGHP